MKDTFKWFLIIGLSLMLSACIKEYSPVDDVVQLKSGESQAFEATSDNPMATLVWHLDGEMVASDTNEYTFTAEQNTTDQIIVHELVVKESFGESGHVHSRRFLKWPSNQEDSVTWTIKILPDNIDTYTFYLDSDQDGYGDADNAIELENPEPPDGYVENDDDCDDANAAINPAAEEVCDEVDNNCNGEIDEGCQTPIYTYYRDSDQDGYGDPGNSIEVTDPTPPAGYVSDNTDCNDANAAINPGAQEVCDEVDNNCNGETDEGGVCTGYTFYRDADGDGYGDPDDSVTSTDPEAPDGYVDNSSDCDDSNAAINPAAEEVCDEVDNNCNGETDEGVTTTYFSDADSDGYGDAGNATEACSAPAGYVEDNTDCDDSNAAVHPGAEEIADNLDNDCDGEIDEDITTTPSPPENVSASDIDSGLSYINVTWEASEGATYYNVYRAIWEDDAEYELVADNITETTYDFVQDWQTDVYDIIGPNPAMAPDADVAAREDFIAALEAYRELATPVLFNFKAPAYFKIEACNDQGCSDMSDFDAGQAEFIHTATESEIAQLVIPTWGYPNLKALADSPPGTAALGWCGIDICASIEGMLMGRLDLSGLPQIDVYYENWVDGWDLHPNARFWANGYIGGAQKLVPSSQGVVEVSGEFDVSMGAVDAHMFVYTYIGGTTGDENDGYISITYNGETHQYTLPVQPVSGQDYSDPPEPVVPARNDADYTINRRDTDYPVPFSEEPNTSCKNWTDDLIVDCNRVP